MKPTSTSFQCKMSLSGKIQSSDLKVRGGKQTFPHQITQTFWIQPTAVKISR